MVRVTQNGSGSRCQRIGCDELDATGIAALEDLGFTTIDVLDIDGVTVGPYMRNTLRVDKNSVREDALFDIYRVMRPGEPPTVEAAEAMFKSLFFDQERYDLSSVGRVKMNMRLELDTSDEERVIRKEDVIEVLRTLIVVPPPVAICVSVLRT